MNKKILVVACLVMMTTVFSGCGLLGGDKSGERIKIENSVDENKEDGNNEESNNSNGDGNYFETMKDLMAHGKNMKCTYTQKIEDGGTADGVIYMAGGNARTEIMTNKGTDHEGEMYAIINKDWVYSWTKGSPTGFKMTTEASEMGDKNEETVSDLAKEIDFKCRLWIKDGSKFEVPTGVEFDDMSEMMKGLGDVDLGKELEDAEAQGNELICELCKNAPASEQAECLGDVVCDWSE